MMLLTCPWCGPRNSTEFRFRGESHARPHPDTATPGQWRDYLYFATNPRGWSRETWYHGSGCRRYFTVERHTESNELRATDEPRAAEAPR
ncbi:sarcosine oxidase subunit delta [Pseudonocardia hispaniensis]|uniref:Sarcosine oxidase subunit delta n=1 Tax=Pseudonocardia hispaniensis TaxID=904933 RepID=A0ABW1J4R2_9PSEU